ncbi:unnamed protein product [Toxocara canis]|uniref:Major sperm protein n=1 Tax=Toxocara canis TaxID=6265 RepID=A0A183VFE0_TOXCA|nr:unnamed protein product [Toxocara canis]
MLRNGTEALRIEPIDKLVFKGPFTKIVTRELNLRNMADRPICFKVKTTAPKQYCVRPNSGIIGAGGANSVSIMLQPFDIAQQSIKHKFLIQSAFVPPGETSFEGAWSRIAPSELVNSKLRVVFEEPSSAQHQHEECSKLIQNGAELESRIRTMTIPLKTQEAQEWKDDHVYAAILALGSK